MPISRGTIEAHGGRLWCESEGPGHGSTFSFTVPALAAGTGDTPGTSSEPAGSAQPRSQPGPKRLASRVVGLLAPCLSMTGQPLLELWGDPMGSRPAVETGRAPREELKEMPTHEATAVLMTRDMGEKTQLKVRLPLRQVIALQSVRLTTKRDISSIISEALAGYLEDFWAHVESSPAREVSMRPGYPTFSPGKGGELPAGSTEAPHGA